MKRYLLFYWKYDKISKNVTMFKEHIMIDYMKKHERYVRETLENNPDVEKLRELLAYHNQQIQWMQHERLVHLIVMLFVCLFTLIIFGFTVIHISLPLIILFVILLGLSIAYIIHYFRLENNVQKWYLISNQIRKMKENESK